MAGSPSASWEEIVDRVSVKSNYYNVSDAALGWRAIFRYLGELQDCLKALKTGSESWTGAAGDGFRDHLDGFGKNLDELHRDHQRTVPGLEALASHLQNAVNTIPIPSWMMSQLEDAQAAYQMGDEVPGYEPGSFGHFYLQHVMGDAYSKIPLVGSAWKALEGWVNDNEQVAKQAYAQLQSNYGAETANIPAGQPVNPPSTTDVPQFNPDTVPSGPGAGSLSGPSAPGFEPAGQPATDPSLNPPVDLAANGAADPHGPDPGTGLAGAGGGLVGAGSGFAGLGPAGGPLGGPGAPGGPGTGDGLHAGGLGPGGIGARGLGTGVPGVGAARAGGIGAVPITGNAERTGAAAGRRPSLGKAVTPPAGIVGNRGAGVAGRGGANRGPGVVPGNGGRGNDPDEENPDGWLHEDDNVWGVEPGGGPPRVLGAEGR